MARGQRGWNLWETLLGAIFVATEQDGQTDFINGETLPKDCEHWDVLESMGVERLEEADKLCCSARNWCRLTMELSGSEPKELRSSGSTKSSPIGRIRAPIGTDWQSVCCKDDDLAALAKSSSGMKSNYRDARV